MSRSPECGQRRPNARTSRRWISSARSSSISCSVIDHASASHGAGAAVDAQVRVRAHRLADHRVAGEALVERPQVLVDAGGEAHPLDRGLGRRPARRARPRTARAAARSATTATSTGSSPTCSSRISDAPRRRRIPSPEPRPMRNGHGGVTSTRRSTGASAQGEPAQSRRSRWTSTRNELLETISPTTPFLRLRAARGRLARRRVTTAAVTAPAAKPVAASAAACRAGQRRGRAGLQHPRVVRDDGKAVDHLDRLFFVFRGQLTVVLFGHARHSMTHAGRRPLSARCGPGASRTRGPSTAR